MRLYIKNGVINSVLLFFYICISNISISSCFIIGTTYVYNPSNSMHTTCTPLQQASYLDDINNYSQPPSCTNEIAQNEEKKGCMEEGEDNDTKMMKGNRFSKFAPDANTLDANDFRSQLKENMKAELERRRAADPNRGNQPTRNYLEGL